MDNKNQPAYPVSEETTDRVDKNIKIYTGLTKREYYAGLAMQGLCANPNYSQWDDEKVTRMAIGEADRLLAELEKHTI